MHMAVQIFCLSSLLYLLLAFFTKKKKKSKLNAAGLKYNIIMHICGWEEYWESRQRYFWWHFSTALHIIFEKSVVFLGRKVVVVTRDKLPILLLILYSWNLIRIIVIFRHWCCNELYTAVSHMQIHFKTSFTIFTRNLSEMITAQIINFRTGRK